MNVCVGSARQDGRDAAGSDGPERFRNRPYTTHERFPHRHLLSALPVEQDQEFQRSEYHQEASEHQRVNLLYPGPCRAQPTLLDFTIGQRRTGATIRCCATLDGADGFVADGPLLVGNSAAERQQRQSSSAAAIGCSSWSRTAARAAVPRCRPCVGPTMPALIACGRQRPHGLSR